MTATARDPRYQSSLEAAILVVRCFPQRGRKKVLSEIGVLSGLEEGEELNAFVSWGLERLEERLGFE